MSKEKDEELLRHRLAELSRNAYYRNVPAFSDFLNLEEASVFFSHEREIAQSSYALWGGYKDAERRVVCFYEGDSSADLRWPISCLKVVPAHRKFQEELTHRDYLGATLGLGVDRSRIGDILVIEGAAYLFCLSPIAPFLMDGLTSVRNTEVRVIEAEPGETEGFQPKFEEIGGTVPSLRLDAILPIAFRSSRSSLAALIAEGKVFVNGRLAQQASLLLKEGDVVSVRGMGKFALRKVGGQTRKGRIAVRIAKYA